MQFRRSTKNGQDGQPFVSQINTAPTFFYMYSEGKGEEEYVHFRPCVSSITFRSSWTFFKIIDCWFCEIGTICLLDSVREKKESELSPSFVTTNK